MSKRVEIPYLEFLDAIIAHEILFVNRKIPKREKTFEKLFTKRKCCAIIVP